VPYQHLTVHKDAKHEAEQVQLAVLRDQKIDFIVLARYMQVLSPEFIRHFPNRIINIHHSFLPAFHGASRITGRSNRGVKLIARPRTTSPKPWMTAQSSSRTWRASRTATASTT